MPSGCSPAHLRRDRSKKSNALTGAQVTCQGAVQVKADRGQVQSWCSVPMPCRTLMRPPFVKRQTHPLSGFWLFFPPYGFWRQQHPVSCSDVLSVHGRQRGVAAPHTYGGSIITDVTIAEPHGGAPLRPRNDAVPSYRPSMLPLLSSPPDVRCSPLPSLRAVSHRPDRSGGFLWRWDPSVSNGLLSVRALTPVHPMLSASFDESRKAWRRRPHLVTGFFARPGRSIRAASPSTKAQGGLSISRPPMPL